MSLFASADPRLARLRDATHAALQAGAIQQHETEFPRSLLTQAFGKRGLSEKQWAWVEKLADRFEKALTAEPAEAIRFPQLAASFLSAGKAVKFPKLYLRTAGGQEVVISRCGNQSRTPGWLSISDGGPYGANVYFGRISPEGEAELRDAVTADVRATLDAFNADPAAEAQVQRDRTRQIDEDGNVIFAGRCMCCGTELTDDVSIALGVGPTCGKRWGISRVGVRAALREGAAVQPILNFNRAA